MSIATDFTVEDIVQKVLGSKLKVIAKDKELLQKQRKKINNSIYLKSQKTLTQKQFIQNYELQQCNIKLQERLKILKKKYQKQANNYKQNESVKEEVQKIKQKLIDITKQNLKLQKQLDKVRITKLKLDSRQNTLNLCSASSSKSNKLNYNRSKTKSKSRSPTKNYNHHNQSLQEQNKNKDQLNNKNYIHPFLINSQKGNQKIEHILQYQNKSIQTDYQNQEQEQIQVNQLRIQLKQKKVYLQQLREIVQSQEIILKDYNNERNSESLKSQIKKKKLKQAQMKTGLKVIDRKNVEQTKGKIVNLTKKINREQNYKDTNINLSNYNRNTKREEISQFLCSEQKTKQQHANNNSPIAGTIIKVKKEHR